MREFDYSKLPKGIQYIPGMDMIELRDYYLKCTEDSNTFDDFCRRWIRRYNLENPPKNQGEPLMDERNCPRALIRETIAKQIELIDTVIVSQRSV